MYTPQSLLPSTWEWSIRFLGCRAKSVGAVYGSVIRVRCC